MKTLILILLVISMLGVIGCQKESVMPDQTNVKRSLPPGQKPKDVLLPINK